MSVADRGAEAGTAGASTGAAAGDAILGRWLGGGGGVCIEIERAGETYRGTIVEGLENGERDTGNPDPALRGRLLLGSLLFEGLTYSRGLWRGGRIYDPRSGRWYGLSLTRECEALRMRAFVGLPLLGRSELWSRLGGAVRPSAEEIVAESGLLSAPASWTVGKAASWYSSRPWPVGCNFIPSTAVNQLEMWQKESFDPRTIDREFGLAQSLGFNALRVYLHFLAWKIDPAGLKERIDRFLKLAEARGMSVLFVLFDDCWNDHPRPGRQPEPRPGVHNSGWVQCPGSAMIEDESSWPELRAYVEDLIRAFARDERILGWDLYNELGNSHGILPNSTRLLARIFLWARSAEPSQPLTSGIWKRASWFGEVNAFLIANSDVLSFHNYAALDSMAKEVDWLASYGKPVLCTEYMARSQDSRFASHLHLLKEKRVGAFNWGLVDGKTQTKYPWGSRPRSPEPEPWFHEIFRAGGEPYDQAEAAAIRAATAANAKL